MKLIDKTADFSITHFGKMAIYLEKIIRLDQDNFPVNNSINSPKINN